MFSFDTDVLILPSFLIAAFILIVSYYSTKSLPLSIISSLIKASLFFIYFGFYFDGTYTFSDDITYLKSGLVILDRGINLFNIYEEWEFIKMINGGRHVGYSLYNAFAIYLFGDYYFSPVIINIILTSFIAYIGKNLAEKEFGIKGIYSNLFFIFILFQPDILAWSTLTNLKDISVLLFHVILLSSASDFLRGEIKLSLIKAIPSSLILLTLRFYVPLLIVIALISSIMISKKVRFRFVLMFFGGILLSLVVVALGTNILSYAIQELRSSRTSFIIGFIRAALSPVPFRAEPEYEFLNLPAIFHWLMAPVAILGAIQIYKIKSTFSVFFIAYMSIFLLLYGIYGELQGPRHRVQLDYALAVLQFIGFLNLLNIYRVKKS